MKRILIVEDKKNLLEDIIKIVLEQSLDYECFPASSVEDALRRLDHAFFSLVITDLMLPDEPGKQAKFNGGIEVVKRAKQRDQATQVIVITSYADARSAQKIRRHGIFFYVDRTRPEYLDILAMEINHAIEKYEHNKGFRQQMVTLKLPENGRGYASIRRPDGVERHSSKSIELEIDLLKAASAAIGSLIYTGETRHRQAMAKFIGRYIWNQIFKEDENLLRALSEAQGASSLDEHLIFNISSNREMLDMPLELFHDGHDFLSLKHPSIRTITNISYDKTSAVSFPVLRRNQRNNKDLAPVRILLVAADSCSGELGPIPLVDKEVDIIRDTIKRIIPYSPDIPPEVDVLHSWDANYSYFLKMLGKTRDLYHIVHFAGHGVYNDNNPDGSAIYLYERSCAENDWIEQRRLIDEWYTSSDDQKNQISRKIQSFRGKLKKLRIATLASKFKKVPPSIVYLSCCHSARVGGMHDLVYSNLLGMMDAIAKSGVPTVIGHRWPLIDNENSIEFVKTFYEKLMHDYLPEQALFWARYEIQDSLDWASVVMVNHSLHNA